jgi:hypothetical protein
MYSFLSISYPKLHLKEWQFFIRICRYASTSNLLRLESSLKLFCLWMFCHRIYDRGKLFCCKLSKNIFLLDSPWFLRWFYKYLAHLNHIFRRASEWPYPNLYSNLLSGLIFDLNRIGLGLIIEHQFIQKVAHH